MILYIATRLFSALYGFDWPLPENTRCMVATFSVAEFVAESAGLIGCFVHWITSKKGSAK